MACITVEMVGSPEPAGGLDGTLAKTAVMDAVDVVDGDTGCDIEFEWLGWLTESVVFEVTGEMA